ncbi:MAG: hypothetical protein WKG07_33560 [Hymenobacter sp.]
MKNLGPTVNTQYSETQPGDLVTMTSRCSSPRAATNVTSPASDKQEQGHRRRWRVLRGYLRDAPRGRRELGEAPLAERRAERQRPRRFDAGVRQRHQDAAVPQRQGRRHFHVGEDRRRLDGPSNAERQHQLEALTKSDAYITPDGLAHLLSRPASTRKTARWTSTTATRAVGRRLGQRQVAGRQHQHQVRRRQPLPEQGRQDAVFLLARPQHDGRLRRVQVGAGTASAASGAAPRTWATPSTPRTTTPTTASAPMARMPTSARYRIGGYGEKDIYTINYIKNANIKGQVFSTKDSTTAIPGVELVFSGTTADKTALSFRDVTKARRRLPGGGAFGPHLPGGREQGRQEHRDPGVCGAGVDQRLDDHR